MIDIEESASLAQVGVLEGLELEEHVFVLGDATNPGLRPGERITEPDGSAVLVYGHVPADLAVWSAAYHLGTLDQPEALERYVAEPPAWALFTRHRLTCYAGGDATECGCAPNGDPDGYHAYAAQERTPGAVPITLVRLP